MHIDDHDHQLARVQPLVDLFLQGAVVVAVEKIVLHDLILIDELLELLLGAVVVVYPFLLPGAGGTGGGRNRFFDLGVGLAQSAHHTVLSGTGGTGNDKQIFFIFHGLTAPLLSLFCPRPDRRHGWPPFRAEGLKGQRGRSP